MASRITLGNPSNFDDKIDAKIETEKVMNIDEKTIRKLIQILIVFETYVHEKTYSSKKANVRKPYESSSKTRVGEGSSTKKKIRKMRNIWKKSSKKSREEGMHI